MSTEENKFLTELQKFSEKSSLEQAGFPELRLKMLKHALNIDYLASDSSLQEYEMDDVVAVKENEMKTKTRGSKKKEAVNTTMSIKISDQKKLPQNLKQMVLVFTPMTKFRTVYNVKTDCIYSGKIDGNFSECTIYCI